MFLVMLMTDLSSTDSIVLDLDVDVDAMTIRERCVF